jgi:hypothetical protein
MLSNAARSSVGEDPAPESFQESAVSMPSESADEDLTVQGDVARLKHVASRLFGLIERQMRDLELLLFSPETPVLLAPEYAVAHEHAVLAVLNLNTSIDQLREHVGVQMSVSQSQPIEVLPSMLPLDSYRSD